MDGLAPEGVREPLRGLLGGEPGRALRKGRRHRPGGGGQAKEEEPAAAARAGRHRRAHGRLFGPGRAQCGSNVFPIHVNCQFQGCTAAVVS